MSDQTNSFQHYVPQFILNYFTENGLVNIYNRSENSFDKNKPKEIVGEKAYYVFTDKSGKENDAVEKMFQPIESQAARIIKNLHEGKTQITAKEKSQLALFLAAQHTRVPQHLEKSSQMSEATTKKIMKMFVMNEPAFNQSLKDFEKKTGMKVPDNYKKDYKKMVTEENYSVKFPKGYILKHMIQIMEEFHSIMFQMEWYISIAPNQKAFISSDNPVYTYNPRPEGFWGSGIGLLAPNCETVAILTPKIAIFLSQKHNPDGIVPLKIPGEMVDTFNWRTAICSKEFVFSHSDTLLSRMVKRTRLSELPQYSKIKVE